MEVNEPLYKAYLKFLPNASKGWYVFPENDRYDGWTASNIDAFCVEENGALYSAGIKYFLNEKTCSVGTLVANLYASRLKNFFKEALQLVWNTKIENSYF